MAFVDELLLLVSGLVLVFLLFTRLKKNSQLLPDIENKAVLITGRQEHFILSRSNQLSTAIYSLFLQPVSVRKNQRGQF
jgi:hypothetical protein